uniref:Uncharacterized protein n=1 Tax=Clastoptera arizonana TaxID=38151 RepID=A0A1B6CIT0_9HEMI
MNGKMGKSLCFIVVAIGLALGQDSNENLTSLLNVTNSQPLTYDETDLADNSTQCYMKMMNATLKCQNETLASDDDVHTVMRLEIPSTDTGKCLVRCLLKARGWMTAEGLFSVNKTASYFTRVHKDPELEPEFIKLGQFCYDKLKEQPIENVDTCQFAYDIAMCCDDYHKTIFPKKSPNVPPVNAITFP